MNCAYYNTSFGLFKIVESDGAITAIDYVREAKRSEPSPLTDLAAHQLEEYFQGVRQGFELPLNPRGTEFQKKVWQELLKIPFGQIRTYGQIAAAIDRPKGARAVGMACHNNPVMIVIPCHRVVGANGQLTGYAGGLDIKKRLLEIEGAGDQII